jgi:hypothetical protein
MSSTYKLIVFKSKWPIVIWLTAEKITFDGERNNLIDISSHVKVALEKIPLSKSEIDLLLQGVKDRIPQIERNIHSVTPIIIQVQKVEFDINFYQSEAVYYAMVGWLAQEFNFDMMPINVEFDEANNRYIFEATS